MGMASWISSFLKLSSYVRPYLKSSKTLSWYPELSARPPLWLLALFIAPASNRWPCAPPPKPPSPAYTVSPTFLAAPLARCYTPLSLASGVSKPLCMSVLKGGSYHQTCSSLASGERQQSWLLTLPASHQLSLGTTYQFLFLFLFVFSNYK